MAANAARSYEIEADPSPISAVEIGIHKGGSLRVFSSYFSNGRILGLDVVLPEDLKSRKCPTQRQDSAINVTLPRCSPLADLSPRMVWISSSMMPHT
jgi:hypothetical protein